MLTSIRDYRVKQLRIEKGVATVYFHDGYEREFKTKLPSGSTEYPPNVEITVDHDENELISYNLVHTNRWYRYHPRYRYRADHELQLPGIYAKYGERCF